MILVNHKLYFTCLIFAGSVPSDVLHYCERFLEFLIDLEALLPTRRFFNTVMDDCHLVVRCQLSNLANRSDGNLFMQVRKLQMCTI